VLDAVIDAWLTKMSPCLAQDPQGLVTCYWDPPNSYPTPSSLNHGRYVTVTRWLEGAVIDGAHGRR
jgi:hypothetical protein